ncbi:MAG: GntR family transcriptional regulator [Clostridia bacterium]|nr:GntR family transcriptional regulator [Clostridia bacterium]
MIVDKNSKSLEENVFLTLEDEILSGKLKRGEILTETTLSSRLGVSRTPLRGALHRLFEEGLIDITPNRSAVVVGIGREELVDIYKMRIRLEGLASAEAAGRISDADKKRLSEIVELCDFYIGKRDAEKLKELDSEFHGIIYRASGNRLLNKTLSELHRNIHFYRKRSLAVADRLERSAEEHKQILSAIERGDAKLADRLTSAHVEAALNNLLTVSDIED